METRDALLTKEIICFIQSATSKWPITEMYSYFIKTIREKF